MAGLMDFFQGLLGTNQPSAPPPQQGAPQATPTSPPQSGIGALLSSPVAQGALASYFAGISSPKQMGWGGAIGRGGLAGLGAYNQAEQTQAQRPLQQAQLGNLQSQGQLHQAEVGLKNVQTQNLAGISEANKKTAQQLIAMKPHLNPDQQQRADLLAGTIMNDTSKVYDPKEVVATLFTEPLQEQKIQADIGRSGAEATRAKAETEAIPKKLAVDEGKLAEDTRYHTGELAARGRAIDVSEKKATTGGKPESPSMVAKRGIDTLKTLRGEFEASMNPISRMRYKPDDLATYVVGKGINPANGQPLPPLPEKGWRYEYRDGEAKAIDPSGTPHHWEE